MSFRRGAWGLGTHEVEARLEWALVLAFLLTVPELTLGEWPWDRSWPRSDLARAVTTGTAVIGFVFLMFASVLAMRAAWQFPTTARRALSRLRPALVGVERRREREILRALDTLDWRIDRAIRTGQLQGPAAEKTHRRSNGIARSAHSLAIRRREARCDTLREKAGGFLRANFIVVLGALAISVAQGRKGPCEIMSLFVATSVLVPGLLMLGTGGLAAYRKGMSCLILRGRNESDRRAAVSSRRDVAVDAAVAVILTLTAVALCSSRLSPTQVIVDEQAAFDAVRLFGTKLSTVLAFSVLWVWPVRSSLSPFMTHKLREVSLVLVIFALVSVGVLTVLTGISDCPWFLAPFLIPLFVGAWTVPTVLALGGASCVSRAIGRMRSTLGKRDLGPPEPLDADGIDELASAIERAIEHARLGARSDGALSLTEPLDDEGRLSLGHPKD
ncbi:MAG: hypothetical protein HYV07_10585 [Deltaproteobacteria bacterium]|nr:hypothetical protein [Deltaproteobacteria bacterium]